jgi:hypothetical protein
MSRHRPLCWPPLTVSARLFVAQQISGPFGTRTLRGEADTRAQALSTAYAFSRVPRMRMFPTLGKCVALAVILVNAALTLSAISLVGVHPRTLLRARGSEEDLDGRERQT